MFLLNLVCQYALNTFRKCALKVPARVSLLQKVIRLSVP
jgi:hypothetical protein